MISKDIVIEGNSLAALVAALELSKSGYEIILLNESNNWGGHLREINISGFKFDPGMILYEFTSFNTPKVNINELNINSINDIGSFSDIALSFISDFQELVDIKTPVMQLGDSVCNDMMISNRIDSIKNLPECGIIEKELLDITNEINIEHPLHPINKNNSHIYSNKSYSYISEKVHGKSLHNKLFENSCRKAIGTSSDLLIAKYHRKAWLPFYYPETLLEAIRGNKINLPLTTFSYLKHSYIGAIVPLIIVLSI